jgi:hypothetical protein
MLKLRSTGTVSISTGTISASGTYTTEAYDSSQLQGYFSLQWTIVGSGTMKAEVLVSNDGVTFFDIDTDIATGKTVGTGMVSFTVTPCNQLKIKFTETAGANTISVTAHLKAI